MEKYKNYLNAFNAFINNYNIYNYNKRLNEIIDNEKSLDESKKELKKKASKLYSEFKKIPEALQLPEIENKINEALAL